MELFTLAHFENDYRNISTLAEFLKDSFVGVFQFLAVLVIGALIIAKADKEPPIKSTTGFVFYPTLIVISGSLYILNLKIALIHEWIKTYNVEYTFLETLYASAAAIITAGICITFLLVSLFYTRHFTKKFLELKWNRWILFPTFVFGAAIFSSFANIIYSATNHVNIFGNIIRVDDTLNSGAFLSLFLITGILIAYNIKRFSMKNEKNRT